jgi:transposase
VAAPWIVDDGLWELIAPLLPPWPARAPGPPPVDDRRCRQPILVVQPAGIGGQNRPAELGFGCGMTCCRRWRRWTDAGIFDQLPQILLAALHAAGAIDWSRAVAAAAHLRAGRRGRRYRSTAPARALSIT